MTSYRPLLSFLFCPMCLCRKASLEARSAVPACLAEGLNVVALEHSPELAIRVASRLQA